MKHIKKDLTIFVSSLHNNKARMIVLVISIALFVLSAGAPNAMGGIGK